MRAAVLHGPGDVRVEERPIPEPGAQDVVARVSHCGICGTDLHMMMEGWGRPGSTGGHEWSGIVVAAGSDVEDLVVGDRIVGGPAPACGRCPACRQGRPSLCDTRNVGADADRSGAFAEYVQVDAAAAVRIPAGLDERHAALAEPLAVALHAITQAAHPEIRTKAGPQQAPSNTGLGPGGGSARVLVSGAGPIGVLTVAALRAQGVNDITVCELRPRRQALAATLGAAVVEPGDLEQISMAEPHRIVDQPFDIAIECSGKAEAAVTALCQLRRSGTLVLVGTGIEPIALDPNRVLLNELVITGAYEYDQDGFVHALDLLNTGAVPAELILEAADIGLHDMVGALQGLAGGAIAGKVLVNPSIGEAP